MCPSPFHTAKHMNRFEIEFIPLTDDAGAPHYWSIRLVDNDRDGSYSTIGIIEHIQGHGRDRFHVVCTLFGSEHSDLRCAQLMVLGMYHHHGYITKEQYESRL